MKIALLLPSVILDFNTSIEILSWISIVQNKFIKYKYSNYHAKFPRHLAKFKKMVTNQSVYNCAICHMLFSYNNRYLIL